MIKRCSGYEIVVSVVAGTPRLVLGIITPFKSQSMLIRRLINRKLPNYADVVSVGTVHTF